MPGSSNVKANCKVDQRSASNYKYLSRYTTDENKKCIHAYDSKIKVCSYTAILPI